MNILSPHSKSDIFYLTNILAMSWNQDYKWHDVIMADWCFICERSGEFVVHLLLHCEIFCALWSVVFIHVGLAWVMPRKVVDLFACWRGLGGSSQSETIWKMISSCLL